MPAIMLDRPATPEEAAAIAAALALALVPATQAERKPAPSWGQAARVEALGLVRRLNTRLDLRYMSAPTRLRLQRR